MQYLIKTKVQVIVLFTLLLTGILVQSTYADSKIEVNKSILKTIKSDAHLKHLVFGHANLTGSSSDYTITNVTLENGVMKRVAQNIPVPSGKFVFVASTQYENCAGLEATREIEIDKSVENSTELSTENSFGAGLEVSAEVSADVGPVSVGGSVSVSASYDFSEGKDYSTSSSVEIDDDEEVDFTDEVGVWVFALYAKQVKTEKLAWWMDFELEDDSILSIEVDKPYKGAVVNFFTKNNFTGDKISLKNGGNLKYKSATARQKAILDEGINSVDFPNDRTKEIHRACLYSGDNYAAQFECFAGSGGDISSVIAYHGGGSNKFKTLAVFPNSTSQTVKIRWGDIKDYFSEEQSRFRITGTLDIRNNDVQSKRFISAKLSPEKVQEVCEESNSIVTEGLFGDVSAAERSIRKKEVSRKEYLDLIGNGHLHETEVIIKEERKSKRRNGGSREKSWLTRVWDSISR